MKHGCVITFEQLPNAVAQLFVELKEIKQLIAEKEESPQANHWLNLQELCEYLPEKPAKATVYTWVGNSSIPYHKKGRKLFFLQSEVEEWLKAGRKKTHAEIAAEAVSSIGSKKHRGA